jgi:phosphatidylglycerophosphate synthase
VTVSPPSPQSSPAPLTVLRATPAELPGAGMRVAGLTVLERALRQLDRQGQRALVALGPGVPVPRRFFRPASAEIAEVEDITAAEKLARARGASTVIAADVVRIHGRDASGVIRVTDAASRRQAEDGIFGELLRGDLGLVARHLNKPISFRVTRYVLCRLPITPNQVTLGAAVIGLLGAALIASGQGLLMVLGFLLAHVQSILDGCDGELARVRFQQSAIGEWLDTIVDDGLNFSLAVATGVGLWRASHQSAYLIVGLVSGGMLLFYNAVAYRELVRQGEGGEVLKIRWWFMRGKDLKSALAQAGSSRGPGPMRLVMTMARRDFFVLAWLILALVGLPQVISVYIFLIAASCAATALLQLVLRPRS